MSDLSILDFGSMYMIYDKVLIVRSSNCVDFYKKCE
jgi:hypothetical protein